MKKYILALFIFITTLCSAQYPKYYTDSNGDEFVIITIEQAQEIDNKMDILKLYENLDLSYQEGDVIYLKVIDKLENQVSMQRVELDALKSVSVDKDLLISKLKDEISLYKENQERYEQELSNKNDIIKEKDRVIRKNKIQKIFGSIGSGIAIIVLTVLFLVK